MAYSITASNGVKKILQRKPNYRVEWEWTDPDLTGQSHLKLIDYTHATNAERAINKVRREIEKEYSISKGDMKIIQVILLEG